MIINNESPTSDLRREYNDRTIVLLCSTSFLVWLMDVSARNPLAQVCWVSALSMPVCVLLSDGVSEWVWVSEEGGKQEWVKAWLWLYVCEREWVSEWVSAHICVRVSREVISQITFVCKLFPMIVFGCSIVNTIQYNTIRFNGTDFFSILDNYNQSNSTQLSFNSPTWESGVDSDGSCVRERLVIISIRQVQQWSVIQ